MSTVRPQTRSLGDHARVAENRGRGADSRAVDERPPLDAWSPSTTLETPRPTGGFRYRWIAEYVNGTSLSNNVQRALKEGYRRVTISELPEDFVVDEDVRGDGYARTGGLILMKFPDTFAEQRKRYYAQRSGEALQAANEMQGVAGRNAVLEDRGSASLTGQQALDALRNPSRA